MYVCQILFPVRFLKFTEVIFLKQSAFLYQEMTLIIKKYREGLAMNGERKWLRPSEAAKLLGLTSRQVTNLIVQGDMRAERSETNRYYIEKDEIDRYISTLKIHPKERTQANTKEKVSARLLEEKINYLEKTSSDKQQQIDFLKQQLSNFTLEKSKMLDAINSHTKLLEHKEKSETKKSIWKKIFGKD